MKTCSRCEQIKPDQSFRKRTTGDALDSHCWACRRQVRNESRRRYPHRVAADKMVYELNRRDPATFAYLTAKHVEAYVANAITRWERSQAKEAHPTLVAIRQLAAKIAAEMPIEDIGTPIRRCAQCGEQFEPTGRNQRFCCKAHAEKNRWQRRAERERVGLEAKRLAMSDPTS